MKVVTRVIGEKMKKNFLVLIEYEGTNFYGWQKQKGQITVQGIIEECLKKIFKESIRIIGQGRIDAGAHALGQTANFHAPGRLSPPQLKEAMNSLLPPEIRIIEVKDAPLDFHARFSAISRTYIYFVSIHKNIPVFLRNFIYYFPHPVDVNKMREAGAFLKGRKDFTSFTTPREYRKKEREIYRVEIEEKDRISLPWLEYSFPLIKFEIEANSFLQKMVRNIVGTLLEVGRGKIPPSRMREILEGKDRSLAGPAVPAHGLFLKEVKYPPFSAKISQSI